MRIIAGKYKGKVLHSFEADNIRPTSDMVKEAICSKLQFDFPGSIVLDLFGGTGNFGFETISRGAGEVYICDNNDKSISIINKNRQLLGVDVNVLKGDYNKCLKMLSAKDVKFDIIFLDPPYATTYGEQAMQVIYKYQLLNEDGILVFEHAKDKQFSYDHYQLLDKKRYGIKEVSYFKVMYDKID